MQVFVAYYPVGHTHDDWDRRFATITHKLNSVGALCQEDLERVIRDTASGDGDLPPVIVRVTDVATPVPDATTSGIYVWVLRLHPLRIFILCSPMYAGLSVATFAVELLKQGARPHHLRVEVCVCLFLLTGPFLRVAPSQLFFGEVVETRNAATSFCV